MSPSTCQRDRRQVADQAATFERGSYFLLPEDAGFARHAFDGLVFGALYSMGGRMLSFTASEGIEFARH